MSGPLSDFLSLSAPRLLSSASKGFGNSQSGEVVALAYLRNFIASCPAASAALAPAEAAHATEVLLAELGGITKENKGFRGSEAERLVLECLKELGRAKEGARVVARDENLKLLLSLIPLPPALRRPSSSSSSSNSSNSSPKSSSAFGPSAAQWACADVMLRTLNNALFLNEECRIPFGETDIDGGARILLVLRNPAATPAEILFLSTRLLFFGTLFEAPFNKRAVEELQLVSVLSQLLHHVVAVSAGGFPTYSGPSGLGHLHSAASEALKTAFNVGLYYPRMVDALARVKASKERAIAGEAWDAQLEGFIEPAVQLVIFLPTPNPLPLAEPLTNAIAVLLNCPVAPYRHIWFSCPLPEDKPSVAKRMANALFPSKSTGKVTLERAPSFSSGSDPFASSSTMGDSSTSAAPPLLGALLSLLDATLARYWSAGGDAEDSSAKRQAGADGIDLEDTLQPLVLLLRKLAAEDDEARACLRARILPADIDRSAPLDKRHDLTGRLIRLMSSVLFGRLARVAGELLLSICDADPKVMTSEIGYGPCAGFLMSMNLASALPTQSHAAHSGSDSTGPRTINPITGALDPTAAELQADDLSQMTDEQKELEAEKLFSLFDRLNQTGVVKVQNPVRAAQESGRFVEIEKEDEERERREREEEEERTEREVAEEMRRYRERKAPR